MMMYFFPWNILWSREKAYYSLRLGKRPTGDILARCAWWTDPRQVLIGRKEDGSVLRYDRSSSQPYNSLHSKIFSTQLFL